MNESKQTLLELIGATNLPQVLWGVETKCQWLTSILLLTIDFSRKPTTHEEERYFLRNQILLLGPSQKKKNSIHWYLSSCTITSKETGYMSLETNHELKQQDQANQYLIR